jgi:VWFA-related protein
MGIASRLNFKSKNKRAILWRVLSAATFGALVIATGTPHMAAPQTSSPPAAPPSAPASGDNPEKMATIRSNVQLVNVPVTALNKRGMPVIDLNKEDFHVFEDGVEQTITHFDRETRMPLRVGLIVETSNSARSRLQYEKDAADQFTYVVLQNGNSTNQIFLETFDASSSIVQDFTSDPELISEKIRGLKSGGGKALYDAIYFACHDKLRDAGAREETRRVLVILSDGLDVQSKHTLDEAISMARMTETMIFTIGTAAYGFTNPGDKLLEDIAEETGGYASFPLRESVGSDQETGYFSHGQIGDTSQNKGLGAGTGIFDAERLMNLANVMDAITRTLDEQYEISYRPQNEAMDGTYRTIKIVMDRRGVAIRWKPGYFARP